MLSRASAPALLLVFLAGCVSTAHPYGNPVPPEEAVVRTIEEAVALARRFVDSEGAPELYRMEAASAEEYPAQWLVTFPKRADVRPSTGLIAVDKRTGAATWMPQR